MCIILLVAQSFEQLTGLVYQILLHVTGFTQSVRLDFFVCVFRFICLNYVSIALCCIICATNMVTEVSLMVRL